MDSSVLNLPMDVYSNSKAETVSVAKKFAEFLKFPAFVALFGDLGAGKTAFVQGFAQAFNVVETVCSPTFSIVNEYFCKCGGKIVHCDMYRILSEQDLYEIGYFDFIKDTNSIILVEWSENILNFLPQTYFKVNIKVLGPTKRNIRISREFFNEDISY